MSESLRIRRSGIDDVGSVFSESFRREGHVPPSAEFRLLQRFSRPGAATLRELHVRDDSGEVIGRHRLTGPLALVGNSRTCDIRLAHSDVSFRHAWLQVFGGRLLAVDLQSRTGVRWSKGRRRFGWLEPGESVQIGPYRIEHLVTEGESGPLSLPSCDPRQLFSIRPYQPPITLEQLNVPGHRGSSKFRAFPIQSSITLVGSGKQCQLRLRHPDVSRVHCGLMWMGTELWVVDLLGKNGTRLNGSRVRLARLDSESMLQVGPFQYVIRFPNTGPVPDHAERLQSARHLELDGASSDDRATRPTADTVAGSPPILAGGYSEQFVMSLVDRMLAMHQQMMTQSQQQMLMMTQMLGAMQQNQQDVLREEIQSLHEITREIQQLHASAMDKSVGPGENQPPAASPDSVFVPMLLGALLQSASRSEHPSQEVESDQQASASAASSSEPIAAAERDSEPTRSSSADPAPKVASEVRAAGDGDATTAPATTSFFTDEQDAPPAIEPADQDLVEGATEPSENVSGSSNDILHHVWLSERMHKLERERESRLKRVFQLLTGQGP